MYIINVIVPRITYSNIIIHCANTRAGGAYKECAFTAPKMPIFPDIIIIIIIT